MIYISSTCIPSKNIKEAVLKLVQSGFFNIELSGGTDYYDGLQNDLIKLKEKYNINYIVHNYFPPPKKHFVLNLASLNDTVFYNSLNHCIQAIELAKAIHASYYGIHAGFLIDIHHSEIGKQLSKRSLFDKEKAIYRFVEAYRMLTDISGDLRVYIENNVFSYSNKQTYNVNPFLLTNSDEYFELKKIFDFRFLLDVAHLKVSSFTHEIDFIQEFQILSVVSDYWHLSGNNGRWDQNKSINEDHILLSTVNNCLFPNTITLEINEELETIKADYKYIEKTYLMHH